MEDKKEINYSIGDIEFTVGYGLKPYETNSGNKYFPNIFYIKLNELDLKPIFDRDLIDEIRVFLFKNHNHITT